MKNTLRFLSAAIVLTLFACGSSQELQERVPAQFGKVTYTYSSDGIQLEIPVVAIQDNRMQLDTVYFHGMKSELVKDQEKPNRYVANFNIGSSDMVMSSDPTEEYGNKAPQKPEKSPFKINDDEAILVFKQDEQTKFYKLTGIVEKE